MARALVRKDRDTQSKMAQAEGQRARIPRQATERADSQHVMPEARKVCPHRLQREPRRPRFRPLSTRGCCGKLPSGWHFVATRQSIRTRTHQARVEAHLPDHANQSHFSTGRSHPAPSSPAPPPSLRPGSWPIKRVVRTSLCVFPQARSQGGTARVRRPVHAPPQKPSHTGRLPALGQRAPEAGRSHTLPQAQSLEGRKRR